MQVGDWAMFQIKDDFYLYFSELEWLHSLRGLSQSFAKMENIVTCSWWPSDSTGCCALAFTGMFCQICWSYDNQQSNVYIRLRDDPKLAEATTKRYVITAPPGHFQLLPSDQVRQQRGVSVNFIFLAPTGALEEGMLSVRASLFAKEHWKWVLAAF